MGVPGIRLDDHQAPSGVHEQRASGAGVVLEQFHAHGARRAGFPQEGLHPVFRHRPQRGDGGILRKGYAISRLFANLLAREAGCEFDVSTPEHSVKES
jgi:hypothetical protein